MADTTPTDRNDAFTGDLRTLLETAVRDGFPLDVAAKVLQAFAIDCVVAHLRAHIYGAVDGIVKGAVEELARVAPQPESPE